MIKFTMISRHATTLGFEEVYRLRGDDNQNCVVHVAGRKLRVMDWDGITSEQAALLQANLKKNLHGFINAQSNNYVIEIKS
jgi:hypothetical protein